MEEKTDATNSDTVHGGNVGFLFLTLHDHATVDQPMLNVDKNFQLNAEQSNFKHLLKFYPNCHERRRLIPDLDRLIAVRATRCLADIPQKHSGPS